MKKGFTCLPYFVLALVMYLLNETFSLNEEIIWTCSKNLLRNLSVCNLACPNGSFALPGMKSCHPWLNCDAKVNLISVISFSVVKTVYLARWRNYNVVLSVLSSKKHEEDFKHNLFMLKSLAFNHHVVEFLGYCNNSIVTKYYELGSALNFNPLLRHSLKHIDSAKLRLSLCFNYASIIQFLHSSPNGILVMCDSNSLEKTLSQYLLTFDLKLVINDLDATPKVNNVTHKGVHCGNKPLNGDLVAPEQVWPFFDKEFDINSMPYYDEKTDIYKIPDVCNWFLGNNLDADIIKYKLFHVHKRCKSIHSFKRPDAGFVVKMYEKVLNEIV